jgi:hypothetical protein
MRPSLHVPLHFVCHQHASRWTCLHKQVFSVSSYTDGHMPMQSGYMRVMRLYDPAELGAMEAAAQAAQAAQSAAAQSVAQTSSVSHSMG